MTIPSLRQIRRGRRSDQPAVETRPRPSVVAVDELRVCSSSSVMYTLMNYMLSIAMFMTSRRHNVGDETPRAKGRGGGAGATAAACLAAGADAAAAADGAVDDTADASQCSSGRACSSFHDAVGKCSTKSLSLTFPCLIV